MPDPYRAMLAISSDIDRTTIETLRAQHRFINTEEFSAFGPGVGLEFASSFWMYPSARPARREVAYFADPHGATPSTIAGELIAYLRAGWIDTLHSYGNFNAPRGEAPAFRRRHAERASEALAAHAVHVPVWVNHGNEANIQNIGRRAYMRGDRPGDEAFHADLLDGIGVRFINVEGLASTPFHDCPLMPVRTADNRPIWGFPRYYKRPVSRQDWEKLKALGAKGTQAEAALWLPQLLPWQLSEEVLAALVEAQGYMVAAQHLGAGHAAQPGGRGLEDTFRRLRRRRDAGEILVTRTSRLLEYARVWHHLNAVATRQAGGTRIDVQRIDDPLLGASEPRLEQLRGITFNVPDARTAEITIGGAPVPDAEIARNPSASTIGLRWFAPDLRDHGLSFSAPAREPA